jgi:VWFA-related protein
MRRALALFALTCCLIAAPPAAGQTPPSTPTFKSRTDLVLVPVIVRDKHGLHVSGLTASDFMLLDNGARQKIASLEEVGLETSPANASEAAEAQPVAGAEFSNFSGRMASAQQPTGVIIIAVDLVNTPQLDLVNARRAVVKFLSTQVKDSQPVGLVAIEPGRVRLLHAFTSSTAILTSALQRVTAAGAVAEAAVPTTNDQITPMDSAAIQAESAALSHFIDPGAAAAMQDLRNATTAMNRARQMQGVAGTLDALRQIASWVAGLPGRKVLIWATGQIPFYTGQSPTALGKLDAENYQRAMKALADANISIYPVDVRGIFNSDFVANSSLYTGPGSDVFDEMLGRPNPESSWQTRLGVLRGGVSHLPENHFAMDDLAKATGGKAFYNRNDIPKMFDAAVADSARYYMLSYYLDRAHSRLGWHKLEVSVSRPELMTRSRTGFLITSAQPELGSARKADENLALVSPFEYTALPVTLRWAEMTPKGDKKRVSFQVSIPPSAGLVSEDHNALDLDFIAAASGGNGEVAGSSSRAFRTELKPDGLEQVQMHGITYVSDLELKPGQYAVRLVVRDNLTGRMGSLTAPLTVHP